MRSNEKSCVCNVFATPYSKNPIKSSLPSYANVNHTFQNVQFKKDFTNLSGNVPWEVFLCISKSEYDKITVLQNIGG